MRKTLAAMVRANKKFNLIQDQDRICVGISGGKDSMALIYCLNILSKILAKEGINFSLVGVHLKFSLCAIDYTPIKKWFKNNNIELKIIEASKIAGMIKSISSQNKSPCGICSRMKKAALIASAKENDCNKVAMGHHGDDAIETLFMNMIHGGRLAVFPPKMFMDRTKMWFIRPLILAREKNIIREINQIDIPVLDCSCPLEGSTQRDNVKEWINQQFYQNPKWKASYENFLKALLNEEQCQLWFSSHLDK